MPKNILPWKIFCTKASCTTDFCMTALCAHMTCFGHVFGTAKRDDMCLRQQNVTTFMTIETCPKWL
jgi:hypothetical protein